MGGVATQEGRECDKSPRSSGPHRDAYLTRARQTLAKEGRTLLVGFLQPIGPLQ